MRKQRLDAIAAVGEYKDAKTGETKTRFSKLGSVFIDDDGRISMKIDTIPCGTSWDGWVNAMEPVQYDRPARQSSEPTRGNRRGSAADFDDAPF